MTRRTTASIVRTKLILPGTLYGCDGGRVDDAHRELLSALMEESLYSRAEKVLTTNSNGPTASGDALLQGESTVDVCVRIKNTATKLYEKNRIGICSSPERPDLKMSQEESFGYLAFDLMRGSVELVPKEARDIGKRLDKWASTEKKAHENAKEKAKDKRKNARTAARNDEAKAASLDKTLAAIEADLEKKRADRLAKTIDLGLPHPNTVVLDGPAPVHWRARAQDSDDEGPTTVAEAQEEAEEAGADADAAAALAKALVLQAERAAKSLDRLPGSERDELGWISFLTGAGEKKQLSDEEKRRRDAAFERVAAARLKLAMAVGEAEAAEKKANCSRQLADKLMSLARVMELSEATQERERAEARMRELQARLDGAAERMKAIDLEKEANRQKERDLVRGRVLMDSQKVWGSVHGTQASAAPKVFKLTGMSAESVQGLSSEVSQVVTSAEERIALAKSVPEAPVAGVAVGSPVALGSAGAVTGVLV